MDGVIKFSDIIKNKFLQEMAPGDLTLTRVLITIALAFAAALFIQYIYRRTFAGVVYNRGFVLSLCLVALVTALIIMPITSNLTLSLGMVGALSIVRFRTAVKEAYDTGFMFWSIAVGIGMGAGFYLPTIVGSLLIGILMVLLNSYKTTGDLSYLLIIHHLPEVSEEIMGIVKTLPGYKLRSKTASKDGYEVIIELKIKEDDTSFFNRILTLKGVRDASLVSHQGDIL